MPLLRKWFRRLLLLLLLLTLGVLFFRDQQSRIQTETIAVTDSRIPAGFDGYRITLISDLHGGVEGDDGNRRLIAAVTEQNPDLIVLTGDIVDEESDLSFLGPLADALAALAPTYYVTGNHEWATKQVNAIKASLREHGVTVLAHDMVPLERNGDTICLLGIDDPNGPYTAQDVLPQLMTDARAAYGDPYTILLAHRNDEYAYYASCQVDLTLSGHAHGGLIRLPFTDGLISNQRTLFPDHTAGRYDLSYGQLVVSRGLGNMTGTFRLFDRPHLPLVVLHTA
jgi:hypothetical protein